MISKVMEDAINAQITRELYSANLYLAMAAYYHSRNLNGFANWMRIQASEEMQHAMKFFDYLLERDGKVALGTIDAPPTEWESTLDAFEKALEHERYITKNINDLADLAFDQRDHATSNMLQWFVNEQVEEEATTGEIVDRLKLAGDSKSPLFMLDSELKSRKPAPAEA
jgi:ferritin